MKQFLFLLTVLIITSGCSNDEKTPAYNDELVGKKFRAQAYINGAGAQVYDVFEFKSNSKVISEYRLSNNNPVNINHRIELQWRKDGVTGTGITVDYRAFTDEEDDATEIKGIVTEGILTFPGKEGTRVYTEY